MYKVETTYIDGSKYVTVYNSQAEVIYYCFIQLAKKYVRACNLIPHN